MTDTRDISSLRILVIGDHLHFKIEYPERVTLLWTGARDIDPRHIDGPATPGRVLGALRDARDGKYDVVVVYPPLYSPWHPRYGLRALLRSPLKPWSSLTRVFGVSLLRWLELPVPLVAVDIHDANVIGRSSVFLLDKAKAFFKRELPVDRWQALTGTVHPYLPTLRFRNSARWRKRMDVFRPISLPHLYKDPEFPASPLPEKTHDIFFAGGIEGNSTVRTAGLAELDRLRELGYRIDHPAEKLALKDYLERMSRSWIVWSPEGMGWDCYRHYEAAIVHSVPLMNNPTILRHAPLLNDVHGLYYDPEPGGLVRRAVAALADKDKLRAMAAAAREHVLAHHSNRARCDTILRGAFDSE
ncbi:MAG: glycosyltransferase family 1 protein [Bradyrhizobiaceae bacterium]|nr:MAG: glycosyltransferase family 1 protein [Bradyrhizobiaceae bacterium]